MDQLFEVLKHAGGNNVGTIIDLLKQAHILDPLKKGMEDKVRELFKDATNPDDISLDKFKEVITKVAEDEGKSVGEITDQLVSTGTDNLGLEDIAGSLDPSEAASVDPSAAASADPSAVPSEAQSEDSD